MILKMEDGDIRASYPLVAAGFYMFIYTFDASYRLFTSSPFSQAPSSPILASLHDLLNDAPFPPSSSLLHLPLIYHTILHLT